MKKVIKKSLLMAVMFTAMVSYANVVKNPGKEKGEITNVKLNNVTEGSVLSIKDINGLVLYKETIEVTGDYSKKFDLTALPDGNYIFELNKENEIKVIPFDVSNYKVKFDKENETIIFKPSIVVKNSLVKISKTLKSNKPLNLKIYYENGELAYAEKLEDEKVIAKTYDFSTSIKGIYRIELSTDSRTFVKEIKI